MIQTLIPLENMYLFTENLHVLFVECTVMERSMTDGGFNTDTIYSDCSGGVGRSFYG